MPLWSLPLCFGYLTFQRYLTLLSFLWLPCHRNTTTMLTRDTSPASCFSSWLSLVVFLERVCVLMRARRSRRLSGSTLVYFKAAVTRKKRHCG